MFSRKKRAQLRLPWILFSGLVLLVFLAGINELLDSQRETALLRQSLETAQTQQTLTISNEIQEDVLSGNWHNVQNEFHHLETLLTNSHFTLFDPQGSQRVDSQKIWNPGAVQPGEILPARSIDPSATWLKPGGVLRVAIPITNDHGQVTAIFVNETDHQRSFSLMYQNKTWQAIQFFIAILLILILFLLINWELFLRPLDQIYRLSKAIIQGSSRERMPDSSVLELQRINLAINEMVDHLEDQQDDLEKMNRQLENTVAERTRALEGSNDAIRERANQLEAINTLIASTTAAFDMHQLLRTALEQSMLLMNADSGMLSVRGTVVSSGIGKEAGLIIRQAVQACPLPRFQRFFCGDLEDISEDHPLATVVQALRKTGIRASFSIPIYANNEPVGLFNLGCLQPHNWTAEETALLEIIVHHLETAIERTQSVEDLREHNAWMGKLVAQGERLNRTFTLDEVIATIGKGAFSLTRADRLALILRDTNQQSMCAWSRGLSTDFIVSAPDFAKKVFPFQESTNLSPILISDTNTLDQDVSIRTPALQEGFRAISAWPLVYENQASAFVFCFYNQPAAWKQSELEIQEAFFRQAAAALENARLFEAECAQRQLAEALRDVTATLTSTLDLNEVLEGILSNLGRVVPHDAAIIMLLDGDILKPSRWQGIPEEYIELFKAWRYPVRSLRNRQRMMETVQAVVIPDTRQDPNWLRTTGLEWVQSYAGAPICQRGEVTGFIDVMSSMPGFFYAEIGTILQAFANQAAIALENARLYYNTQQRMAETSALYRAVQPLFNSIEDVSLLARMISESVTQEFASAHCSILLVSEDRQSLVLVAQSGSLQLTPPALPLDGPGLTVAAVQSGKTIYSPDVTQHPIYVAGAEQSRCELAIPLHARGQVIGVLNMESTEVNAFDERGQRLLTSFAEQVALGLDNARLFATVRQNAEQMAQLNEIAQHRAQEAENLRLATAAISSTLDLHTVLDSILNHLEQVLPHDSASMFLAEGDHLRVRAAKNLTRMDEVVNRRFPRNNGLFMEIEQQMRPVTLSDAQSDPRFENWGGTDYVHGWIGVPMIAGNEFTGILTMDRKEFNAFKPEEIELAQAFANQAAIAVQNARLYEAAQLRARELEALHTATTSLVSTLDLQTLLERILEAAISAIPAARAATLHLLDENGQMRLRVQHGLYEIQIPGPEWNEENRLRAWVLEEHQPLLVSGSSLSSIDPSSIPLPLYQADNALLIAPLIQENQSLGVITLIAPELGAFAEQDLRLLISFASTATAAIHNAQLHSAVQHMAITDPLTAIYNRRGFFDLALNVFSQSKVYNQPLSAIMIDIDYFKHINDRYGHDAGDVVLRTLADRCRKVLRETDLICRYGGEEFAILLPESDVAGAQAAANRLFKSITETPIETAAGPVRITISLGIATFSDSCESLDLLLKRADKALYLAKGEGRNQVRAWSE